MCLDFKQEIFIGNNLVFRCGCINFAVGFPLQVIGMSKWRNLAACNHVKKC